MNFKEWLYKEEGTATSSVAVFARPIGMATRTFPPMFSDLDKKCKPEKKKKKEKEE